MCSVYLAIFSNTVFVQNYKYTTYTLYTIYYTLYCTLGTLYNVLQCTLYTVQL